MSVYLPDQEWMEEHLERYLDGELPLEAQQRFEKTLASDPLWMRELTMATQIRTGLHSLETPACPDELTAAVLAYAHADSYRVVAGSLIGRMRGALDSLLQPALTMAMLIAIVVAASTVRPAPPTPASAEVLRATEEVKWALAYLSKVSRETGRTVRDDVLEPRVVKPIEKAVGAALQGRQVQN